MTIRDPKAAEAADTSYADTQRALARAARPTPFDAAAFLAMHRAVNEVVSVDGDGIYIYIGDNTGTPDLTEMWAGSDWKKRTPDWIAQVIALLKEEGR
jgi:hypothetical protein